MSAAALAGSLDAAADRVGALDARFLLLALAAQLAHLLLRGLAWRNALAAAYPDRDVPAGGLAAAYVAGVALNSFVPARGGEAAKIALARTQIRRSSLGTIAGASALVLALDLLVTAALALVAAAWGVTPGVPRPPLPAAGLVGAHAVVAAVAAVMLAAASLLVIVRLGEPLRRLGAQLRQGTAIVRSPARYLREVASLQALAWACRLGVAFFLLAAFDLRATLPLAALVVVAGGLSTLMPVTPGGVGAHQALLAFALHGSVSTGTAVSFSIGMQVAVAAVNAMVGVAGLMLLFGTLRPVAAARGGIRLTRERPPR